MPIDIERLHPDRLDDALAVFDLTLGKTTVSDRQDILDRMQSGRGIFYIAVESETHRVVGLKFGNINDAVCIGRGIAVLPAYRRQGIATRLLKRFQKDLGAHPDVRLYAFGSGTTEGIPFHIASGYVPRALIQFQDPQLRHRLDLSGLTITQDGFNETHKVYQIYVELGDAERSLAGLRQLQDRFADVNVQFMFSKPLIP